MIILKTPPRAIGLAQFNGNVTSPKTSLKTLLDKYAGQLKDIKLPFDPDKPTDRNRYLLAELDRQLQAKGKPSLFEMTEQKLKITGESRPTTKLDTSVPGTYKLRFQADGKTRKGNPFQRQSLNSLTV